MKKLLIGTGNQAKVNSYKKLLKDFNFEIVSAKDLNIAAPEENANTFEEEATQKAKYYFEKSGITSVVDDGGFQIEALNGEPGIKSRRWIGREMSDEEIISEVFKRMQGITNRAGKHVIVMALASPLGIFTAHGEIVGIIPEKPSEKREKDFPYRSVLFLPNYNKYWCDISPDEDEIINHRKVAIEKLKDIFEELTK